MSLEDFASRGLKAQTAMNALTKISSSSDVAWLRSVMASDDRPLSERTAAQKRLRCLARKGKG